MRHPAAAAALVLGGLFIVQFAFLCWCNLTQWQSHLDGDSSTQLVKVLEIWKAGSLSLSNWNDTTTLLLDMPLSLAAALMPLFRDPFSAYGVSSILWLALLIYGLWQLLRRADCPLHLRFLALVQMERREKGFGHLVTWLFTLGLGAWIAMSSGTFMLLLVLLPVIAGFVLRAFAASRPRLLLTPGAAFLALNLLGFGAGCFVQRYVIRFSSRDSIIAWNTYTEFLPNLSKVIQGYLKLTNALPADGGVTILGAQGIMYGISFVVSLVILCGILLCLWRILHAPAAACRASGTPRGLLFACLLGIVGVDTLILIGTSLAYGELVYESRYLIFLLMAAVLLLVLCLPWFRRLGGLYAPVSVVLAAVCVANAFLCDYGYVANPSYDFSYAETVTDALDEAYPDVRVVYMVTDDHDRRVLRIADETKVYRLVTSSYTSGDYTYYQDGTGLENGTLLLATDKQYAAMEPELAARFEKTDMPQFRLYMDATGYSTNDPQPYNVYYCAGGGIDLSSLPY